MSECFVTVAGRATFDPARATKADLWAGGRLFVGLNCFEPGQQQPVHTHTGSEKFYFLLSGKARLAVGAREVDAEAGDMVWAPAGVPHGVVTVYERTTMLVAMAPPPRAR